MQYHGFFDVCDMFQDPLYHAVVRLQSVNLIWHEKTEFKRLLSD